MSKIEVNQIDTISGSSTLLVGPSAATKLTFSSTLTVDFNVNSPGVTLGGTMKNTPAFYATSGTTDQSVSDETTTKINLGTEVFDTDSAYDTSNSKFTVPTGKDGKYLINWSIDFLDTVENTIAVAGYLYKNGSAIHIEGFNANAPANAQFRRYKVDGTVVLELSAGDYLELYTYINTDTGNSITAKYNDYATYMQGYKLIGA